MPTKSVPDSGERFCLASAARSSLFSLSLISKRATPFSMGLYVRDGWNKLLWSACISTLALLRSSSPNSNSLKPGSSSQTHSITFFAIFESEFYKIVHSDKAEKNRKKNWSVNHVWSVLSIWQFWYDRIYNRLNDRIEILLGFGGFDFLEESDKLFEADMRKFCWW